MSYRVFASTAICAGALLLALAGGCDKKDNSAATQPAPRPPEVGMVDLDQVATDLGLVREMKTNLEVLEKELRADLLARQTQLNTNFQAEAQRLGVKEGVTPTPQQNQALAQVAAARQQLMARLEQIANQQYAQYQAEWLKRCREALEPIVKDVGFARKTRLVVMKSDGVLYFDTAIDLSSAVTEAARVKPPIFSPPNRPQLPPLTENGTTGPSTGPNLSLAPAATSPATRPAATAPAPTTGKK